MPPRRKGRGKKKVQSPIPKKSKQTSPKLPVDAVPDFHRLPVPLKIQVWDTASTLGNVPKEFASYIDLLDDPTYLAIHNLAAMEYLRERRTTWDKIHEEVKLLPRCPEHDTVRPNPSTVTLV